MLLKAPPSRALGAACSPPSGRDARLETRKTSSLGVQRSSLTGTQPSTGWNTARARLRVRRPYRGHTVCLPQVKLLAARSSSLGGLSRAGPGRSGGSQTRAIRFIWCCQAWRPLDIGARLIRTPPRPKLFMLKMEARALPPAKLELRRSVPGELRRRACRGSPLVTCDTAGATLSQLSITGPPAFSPVAGKGHVVSRPPEC